MGHPRTKTTFLAHLGKTLAASLAAVVVLLGPATELAAHGQASDTQLSVARESDGTYRVHGEFTVLASRPIAWDVLTDYANLPSFVSSLRRSVVTARQSGSITVVQHGEGKVGPFTRSVHVTLEVVETEPTRIDFRDVSGRTFASYSGTWVIAEIPDGVHVTYDVRVLPRTAPPVFGRTIVGRNARHLLDQVRCEMARRTVRTASR
jgi:hypothetical protein